jgi:hypothetical protein
LIVHHKLGMVSTAGRASHVVWYPARFSLVF